MKQLRPTISHPRLWLALLALIIFSPLMLMGWLKINSFYKDHYIQTNVPVEVKFQPIFEVRNKEKEIVKEVMPEYQGLVDTPVKEYVCETFGVMNCKIALGIIEAE